MEAAGTVSDRRVLLIVGGGIAAYKCLELVRLLRGRGIAVRPVLTEAGAKFVTPCPSPPFARTRSTPTSSP